jgi:hypothetical protein
MSPETQLSVAIGTAVFTSLGWALSVAVAALKGKAWIEDTALRTIKSAEGRAAVLEITNDRHASIDLKLDSMARALEMLATRLEGRIDQMGAKLEAKLDRLDRDTHSLDKRLAVLEHNDTSRGDE